MHGNRERRSLVQMRYANDYWLPYNNEGQRYRHTVSVNAHTNNSVCSSLYSRITGFFRYKPRYNSGRAWNTEVTQIRRAGRGRVKTPLGMFRVLPRELLHIIFDRISAKQLLFVSLTSSAFNDEVQYYLLLENAHRKFWDDTSAFEEENAFGLDSFYLWGMLLKASTIVANSRKRRSFLTSFYSKNASIKNWSGWGRCFMAFCEKWDFYECEMLMHAILHFTDLDRLMYEILPKRAGRYSSLEMEIRLRIRGLFFNYPKKDERDNGFWVSAILRTQRTVELQGKLFMILFGPIRATTSGHEIIDWEVLCHEDLNLHHTSIRLLGPIALGFQYLASIPNLGRYAWTDNQIFMLLEQISTTPNTWAMQNCAALLALRPRIIHIALLKRLSEGRMNEAAYLFHALKNVLHRWGIFVSGAISDSMLRTFQALPVIHRRLFLGSILKAESYRLSTILLSTPCSADGTACEECVKLEQVIFMLPKIGRELSLSTFSSRITHDLLCSLLVSFFKNDSSFPVCCCFPILPFNSIQFSFVCWLLHFCGGVRDGYSAVICRLLGGKNEIKMNDCLQLQLWGWDLERLMPKEACEFCRRARARHKTRKKAGVFWYSSRGSGRADWKQKSARFPHLSSRMLVMHDSMHKTNEVDKRNEAIGNPKLQALVDLFNKENEIEEVPSPQHSASILPESANSIEAVDEQHVLTRASNQMSKEAISVNESRSAEKPGLVHFKIAEITLKECVDLLQSVTTANQCMDSGSRP
ncbi:unnamed protein product [Litomosoides sigmodontis]|uniref:FBXO47 ARM repeats region domain-containing protein n=1 Tax=Litomosoides sigmodontis TaxID=42156 RepID=A0A3P6TSC1_LITSI|nr:unnamed protein product [Litomosoides sigmodontis]